MSEPETQEIIIRPDVESPPDRTELVVKALRVGSDSPIDQSNKVQPEDVAQRFRDAGALIAPYDPATMTLLLEHSNSLRQNVDAYVTNIDAFGYHLEATLKLDSEKIVEDVRTAMVEEALLKHPDAVAIPRPSDDEVQIRIEQIKKQMQIEHSRMTFFFKFCCPDQSFTSLRRKMRQDLEVTGNAYWEVMRNKKEEIAQLDILPSSTLRILPLERRPIQIKQRVMTTAITYDTRPIFRRFRRFVQTFQGHNVYFKEFGDPRVVSAETGNGYESEEAMMVKEGADATPANEVLHFFIYSPSGPYGVPRWIGALLEVLGSRQAAEVNLLYFENKSVPPMVMMVSGGRVTEETVKRIEDFIKNDIKGKKNFHNILLLEAEGPLTQGGTEHTGRMKIELRPLTQAINSDALFQKYDEKNMQKVGQAFRLPPLLRGDSRDFNRACYDSQTETLTENGWKTIDQFVPGEKIAAYSHEHGCMEFIKPESFHVYDVDEELLHFSNTVTDIMVTEDHTMLVASATLNDKPEPVFQVHKSHEIPWTRYKLKTTVSKAKGSLLESFSLPKSLGCQIERGHDHTSKVSAEDFLEFLGYWLSEGSLLRTDHPNSPYIVTVGQKAGPVADKMRACFDRLGWAYSESSPDDGTEMIRWTWSNRCLRSWLNEHCGGGSQEKKIPAIARCLDPAHGRILFDSLMAGDGHWDARPGRTCGFYPSVSRALVNDVQALALSLGYRATVGLHYPASGNRSACWRVQLSSQKDSHFIGAPKRVHYQGRVYCFSVPSHGFFVTRRNGKVAVQGNTANAVLQYTEKQVFAPERNEFDDKLNRTIMADCGVCFWKFTSNSPKITDPEEQAKVLERLVRAGTLIPEEARTMTEEILNQELKTIRQPWTQIPFPLSVAGRVDELIMLGAVMERLEEMMADGIITPAEQAEADGLISDIGDGDDAGGGDPPPAPKPEDDEEDAEKADLSGSDLSQGGLLVPGQGRRGKFRKLPPKIESIAKDLVSAMNQHKDGKVPEAKTVTLQVPQKTWTEWMEGFTPDKEGDSDA